MRDRLCCSLLVLCLAIAGCGKPATIASDTPKATAEALVAAIKAQNYEAVAEGWDYESYARRENPDWDTFGDSQRKLIVDKLKQERVEAVRALAGMLAGEVKVGGAQLQGGQATVQLTAGPVTLTLLLTQSDGLWKVASVSEQPTSPGQ